MERKEGENVKKDHNGFRGKQKNEGLPRSVLKRAQKPLRQKQQGSENTCETKGRDGRVNAKGFVRVLKLPGVGGGGGTRIENAIRKKNAVDSQKEPKVAEGTSPKKKRTPTRRLTTHKKSTAKAVSA